MFDQGKKTQSRGFNIVSSQLRRIIYDLSPDKPRSLLPLAQQAALQSDRLPGQDVEILAGRGDQAGGRTH